MPQNVRKVTLKQFTPLHKLYSSSGYLAGLFLCLAGIILAGAIRLPYSLLIHAPISKFASTISCALQERRISYAQIQAIAALSVASF